MSYAPLQPPSVPPFTTPIEEIDTVIRDLDRAGLDHLSRLMREFRTTRAGLKIALAEAEKYKKQVTALTSELNTYRLEENERFHNSLKVGDFDGSTIP